MRYGPVKTVTCGLRMLQNKKKGQIIRNPLLCCVTAHKKFPSTTLYCVTAHQSVNPYSPKYGANLHAHTHKQIRAQADSIPALSSPHFFQLKTKINL